MTMEEFMPNTIKELERSLFEEFRNAGEKRRIEMIRQGLFKKEK